jgi:UDP-N-acetyl-D-mannosaminuronic acid dehydrogenase
MLRELRENDRIIGSRLPDAAERAKELYARVVTGGTIRLTDDLTAEMCKLVENTFRDINIAYANELSVVCDKLGIDVFRLIELANCHPRVNVHSPGVGVGGHCIAVDPWFVHEKFRDITPLILTARQVNDGKPAWVADKVASIVSPPACVAVLGLSYKAGTDDLRQSPSLELCELLRGRGYNVVGCEPNIKADMVKDIPNLPLDEALERCSFAVVTLADNMFRSSAEKIRRTPHFDCVGILR